MFKICYKVGKHNDLFATTDFRDKADEYIEQLRGRCDAAWIQDDDGRVIFSTSNE